MLEANTLQLETEGVTVHDSAFNFNTGSFTRGPPVLWSADRLIEVPPKVKDEGASR